MVAMTESTRKKDAKPLSKEVIKEIEKHYREQYSFCRDLISHFPKRGNQSREDDSSTEKKKDPIDFLKKLPARLYPAKKGGKVPAQTIEELRERLGKLKGVKKLNYKNKLEKKNLKNRILKREKKERRKQTSKTKGKIKTENSEIPQKKQKPIYNSEGEMIFSKFDFSVLGAKKSDLKKKQIKDPEIALKKIKEKENVLKSLKEAGEVDRVRDIVEKRTIKTALMKSEGMKVKDDVELLKKSIKKKQSKKERSAKKWAARENTVKKDHEERQKKRLKNIQARAQQKKLGKMKKAAKKGRIVPGF